jgi:hypothetical protein
MKSAQPLPTVLESTLRDVAATGVVETVTAVGKPGHFVVVVRIGDADRLIAGTRGKPRAFASVASVVTFLTRMGVFKFQVDSTEYKRGRVRGPRPDRAEAMRKSNKQPAKKAR